MEKIPSEAYWMQLSTLMPVYFNIFMEGCTLGWLANAIVFFQQGKEVTATSFECELFSSCLDFGRLLLSIPCGLLVDRFPRNTITIGAGLLNFIGWVLLSITSSTSCILFARFFQGIANALTESSTAVVVGETASNTIRAKLSGISNTFFTAGLITPSLISISFSSYFILSYCLLALSISFFITLFWILETPYYLISVSKIHNARTNLEYVRRGYAKEEIDFEFDGIQKYVQKEKEEKQQVNWFQFMKTNSIRKPLITAVMISCFITATGIGLVNNFITVIVPRNEIVPTKYYPIIMQFAILIFSSIFPLYVEKFPRRKIFLIGIGFVCVNNLFLALTYYLYMVLNSDICELISIIGILAYVLSTVGCLHQMRETMKSELFPQSVKGFGSSLCAVFQALANIVLHLLYVPVTSAQGQYFIFIILAANSIILYIIVYFRLPETKGQYLADLQKRPNELTIFERQTHYGSVKKLLIR